MVSSTTNLCNTWKRFWWIASDNEHRVRPTHISWAPLCAVRQLCVKRCAAGCVYTANNTQVGFKLTPAYLAAVEIREPLNLCWRRREQPSNLNSIDFIIPSNVLRVLKVSSAAASPPPPPTRSLPPPATLYLKSTARLGRRANLCAISAPSMCAFVMRGDFRSSLYAQLAADNEKLSCEIGSNLHEFNRELRGKLLADNIFAL